MNAFAREVGDQARLDYLYVLTVADVRGTNPKLWNSWKATLFDELYERVKRRCAAGSRSPLDREQLMAGTQAHAREQLDAAGVDAAADRRASGTRSPTTISCATPRDEIAWHTRALADARRPATRAPLVAVAEHPGRGGATVVLVHTTDASTASRARPRRSTSMGLSIQDARITPTADGGSLDSYLVLEDTGLPITDRERMAGDRAPAARVRSPSAAPRRLQ